MREGRKERKTGLCIAPHLHTDSRAFFVVSIQRRLSTVSRPTIDSLFSPAAILLLEVGSTGHLPHDVITLREERHPVVERPLLLLAQVLPLRGHILRLC